MLFLLILPTILVAQELPPIVIDDFSGGLNTNSAPSRIRLDQAYRFENLVNDDPIGAATIRSGYHAVSDSLSVFKRIYSLNAYKFPSGGRFLFQLVQRDTAANYCALYASADSGYGLTTLLDSWIYPDRGVWVNWLEKQYYFNGRQPPISISGGPEDFKAQPLTLPAPGQLTAVPVAETGNLKGEYLYAVNVQLPCTLCTDCSDSTYPNELWSRRASVMSEPIIANNEKIRISNFSGYVADSICSPPDSMIFRILRNRANKYESADTLFICTTIVIDTADISDFVWIDNLTDASIESSPWRTIQDTALNSPGPYAGYLNFGSIPQLNEQFEWWWGKGAFSGGFLLFEEGVNNAWTPGSPTLLGRDIDTATNDLDTLNKVADNNYAFFQVYFVYYLDTLTGQKSDTSRSLWTGNIKIDNPWYNPRFSLKLGLPVTPDCDWARVIVRADYSLAYITNESEKAVLFNHIDSYELDTIYNCTTSTYLDFISNTRLLLKSSAWARRLPESIFKGAIVHEGRLFAWDDFRLWGSATDSAGFYDLFESVEFDLDDGDVIEGCASFHGYIVVYKKKSTWILYTQDGDIYNRVRGSKGLGLISYATVSPYAGQNFFLDRYGVVSENDNPQRSEAANRTYISNNIENLLLRPTNQMTDAYGVMLGHRYYLSFPGSDSTFVYFVKTDSWSVFTGLDIWAGIEYDTTGDLDNFWFVKDDDERLFILDESDTTDDGASYVGTWEKRHIARNYRDEESISKLYVATEADVPAGDSITFRLATEEGDTIATANGSLAKTFTTVPFAPINNLTFQSLRVQFEIPNRTNVSVTGIQLQINNSGESE